MEMEKVDPRSGPEQTVDTDVVEMVRKQNEKLSLWGKEFVTISIILLSKPGPSYIGVQLKLGSNEGLLLHLQ